MTNNNSNDKKIKNTFVVWLLCNQSDKCLVYQKKNVMSLWRTGGHANGIFFFFMLLKNQNPFFFSMNNQNPFFGCMFNLSFGTNLISNSCTTRRWEYKDKRQFHSIHHQRTGVTDCPTSIIPAVHQNTTAVGPFPGRLCWLSRHAALLIVVLAFKSNKSRTHAHVCWS